MKQLFSYLVFKLHKQMGMEKIDFRVKGINLIKEKHGYENEFQRASCLRYWPFETILLTLGDSRKYPYHTMDGFSEFRGQGGVL